MSYAKRDRKDFDIIEFAKQRSEISSNMINPVVIAEARMKSMEDPIAHL